METARPKLVLHLGLVRFLTLMLGALTLFATATGAAAVEYESRDLDTYFIPTDINDSGWVVGRNSNTSSAVLRAGRFRDLVSNAHANAVNNAGVVVGEHTDASGRHAFRTTPTQSDLIEDLGLLANGTFSVATAINETGTAAGYANTKLPDGSLVEQAVYFPAGQKEPKSIGHLAADGGKAAYAYGINDNGDIVGAFKKTDGKYQPFRYLAGGDLKPLPGFTDVDAKAIAINTAGRIIGNLTYADGRQRGYIFENGTRKDIEAPAPDVGKNTWTNGLNESGEVVGSFACASTTCPFVLNKEIAIDLSSTLRAGVSGSAHTINNRSEIAIFGNDNYYRNVYYSLVLSPPRPRPVVQYSGLPSLRPLKTGDAFGSTLALHGNVAVIGAPGENGGTGAVYVYKYGDLGWIEEPPLTATNAKPGGRFGASVAFDGDTIVVGAPSADAAYVFKPSGSGWEQTAVLSTGTYFGAVAVVDVKGGRVVVGAPNANGYHGAVYVFDWNGALWEPTKLVPADLPATYYFGTSVQLDGDSVLAGATGSCYNSCADGAVYIFQRQTSGWSELKLLSIAGGYSQQIVVQNDTLAIGISSNVHLFRRGTTAENKPWVEQDWVTSYGPVAVDGDRLVVTENYAGKYLPLLLKREGRIWVDAFNVTPVGVGVSALALQGSTLLVGSSTGAGVVTPFSICAEPPCANMAAADIEVKIESPATARTSELMMQTIVVTNLHDTAAAGLVTTESTFTDSNGITPSWIGVPDACRVSLSLAKVTCGVSGLAARKSARFELHVAAPAVAGGTLTHKATALHARPDPDPTNNIATATTTIVPSGEPRIEIYTPYDGQNVKRGPNAAIELRFEIQNFTVVPNGDYFTVRVDTVTPLPYYQPQTINLGLLSHGSHSITIALMTKNSTTPVVTKTISFSVEVATPSVVINYPRADEPVICHKGELIAPRITVNYWKLGESGKHLQLQIGGQPLGEPITSESGISAVNLCALTLDTTHNLTAVLRDGAGKVETTSTPVTFELRKTAPKVEIKQPSDGTGGYARGGFTLYYNFEPGYDEAQLSFALNDQVLSAPPPAAGTNSFLLPQELLRDGPNQLVVTVATHGKVLQTMSLNFSTQTTASDQPKSKGGTIDPRALALLLLLFARRALPFSRSRIPIRHDLVPASLIDMRRRLFAVGIGSRSSIEEHWRQVKQPRHVRNT